jgi:hypothetical protein
MSGAGAMSDEALKQSHAALLNALECLVKELQDPAGYHTMRYYIEMAEDAIDTARKLEGK